MIVQKRALIIALLAVFCSVQPAEAGVLTPPENIIKASSKDYPNVKTRHFQGISSLAVSPEGRIWVTWYGGPTPSEDKNNYAVLATSGDNGKTWQELMVVDPDGPGQLRAYDPQVWLDPQGSLWWFWAQAVAYGDRAQTWAMAAENPDDKAAGWSEPFHIAQGVIMGKPTVLKNGDWLMPVSDWAGRISRSPNAATAAAYISESEWAGESFTLLGTALVPIKDRSFDEHMIVEKKDGSLWLLARTKYGIGESFSEDGGKTWSRVSPSDIKHPSARFFIRRLNSGNLLLVKHGPINEKTGRRDLMAFISEDDGKTWQGGLMLDERKKVSYPDGQQTSDGKIYITYDCDRYGEKKILMAVFTEKDALAGEAVTEDVRLRVVISKNPSPKPYEPALPEPAAPYAADKFDFDDNSNESPVNFSRPAEVKPVDGGDIDTLEIGARIWSNRKYVFSVLPEKIKGKKFIRSKIEKSKAKAESQGYVYVIGKQKAIEEELLKQGFEKTDIPQFIPFAVKGQGSYYRYDTVSVYQKYVEKGDTIEYGKWGITLVSRS
ncbi:putative neuraminidase (sialidase) [Sedimentisphaera cyanobacteriorum]|uniref:Putative neuraminidase (Sialidase) n=1 Tax=Sedimentisphaera cyanobacteriorum TaxID=1940790 RepID=A0A1Q2HS10_9BACT|nr:sialidase family protein [Sedimentisphaera cyanobacteriorum]AQQ10036.1 putative neuraminidase (sialidase) [Sedimentisphaera cyanobacteriorum]